MNWPPTRRRMVWVRRQFAGALLSRRFERAATCTHWVRALLEKLTQEETSQQSSWPNVPSGQTFNLEVTCQRPQHHQMSTGSKGSLAMAPRVTNASSCQHQSLNSGPSLKTRALAATVRTTGDFNTMDFHLVRISGMMKCSGWRNSQQSSNGWRKGILNGMQNVHVMTWLTLWSHQQSACSPAIKTACKSGKLTFWNRFRIMEEFALRLTWCRTTSSRSIVQHSLARSRWLSKMGGEESFSNWSMMEATSHMQTTWRRFWAETTSGRFVETRICPQKCSGTSLNFGWECSCWDQYFRTSWASGDLTWEAALEDLRNPFACSWHLQEEQELWTRRETADPHESSGILTKRKGPSKSCKTWTFSRESPMETSLWWTILKKKIQLLKSTMRMTQMQSAKTPASHSQRKVRRKKMVMTIWTWAPIKKDKTPQWKVRRTQKENSSEGGSQRWLIRWENKQTWMESAWHAVKKDTTLTYVLRTGQSAPPSTEWERCSSRKRNLLWRPKRERSMIPRSGT